VTAAVGVVYHILPARRANDN